MNCSSRSNSPTLKKIKNHADIQFIGYVHEDAKQNFMQSKLGTIVPLSAQGWDHFR